MAKEVIRQYLPLLDEEGRGAATDDSAGRDRHYLPDTPEEDPYQAGHRTCAGCGPAIEYRWVLKAAGQDTVVAGPTGCMYVANSTYLCTPYTVPWAHTPIASGGSFTAGMAAGYEALIRKGRHPGPYPNIIVMAGDGSASDIGLGSISGALYRNHDALFICYDNECYANTGIQVSPTTPYGSMTTFTPFGKAIPEGTRLPPKNLARMMAEGHPHCYVATATVGYPVDLINKTRKGLNHRGAAFMHCFTPCQKGWVYQTSMTVEIGRRVVEAGLFPVWEYDPEERKYHYFHPPVQRPVTDYLAMQGRFGHMLAEHIATIQQQANRNWETIGMDVPAELRAGEDPEHHQRHAGRDLLHAAQPWRRCLAPPPAPTGTDNDRGATDPQTSSNRDGDARAMADPLRQRSSAAIPARPAGGAALRAGRRAQGGKPTVRGVPRVGSGRAERRLAGRPGVLAGGDHRPGPARRGRTAAGGTVRARPAGSPAAGNAVTGHAATGRAAMTGPDNGNGLEPGSRTIIPLMAGVARPRGERRVLMREAVVEVVGHLVLKAVPPADRSPLFDQARDLLTEAGWGLDELFEAAHDGPARRDLFRLLGLEE